MISRTIHRILIAVGGAVRFLFLLLIAQASAQTPGPDSPPGLRFEIVRFAVEGNSLLKAEETEHAVAPFVGRQKDFSDIQRALEALEQAYRDRGYSIVQVQLPEQDITRGVVRLRVIEPRIGSVLVEGNRYFNPANVRASLPQLKPGASPNSIEISRNLQLLAEHPAKQTIVLLKAGRSDSEIDATVQVMDEHPLKFVVGADSSGTEATGRFRTSLGLQYSNAFNRDHVAQFKYVTDPGHPGRVSIAGAGYRIPFYAANGALDLFAGYSDVDFGVLHGLFNISGSGTIFGASYSYYLPKLDEYEHKVHVALDYRAFKNSETIAGAARIPDVTIHPLRVGYSGLWRKSGARLDFHASVSQNVAFGSDGRDFDIAPAGFPRAARAQATSHYRIIRAGLDYTQAFARQWQARVALNGQYTADALVPGELFGAGGADSVRGFNGREIANDRGFSANFEVYTPDLAARSGSPPQLKARLLVFYDLGNTFRNKAQLGELSGQDGASAGFGMRVTYGRHLSLRADFAQVIDAAGAQARNDSMWHAGIMLTF